MTANQIAYQAQVVEQRRHHEAEEDINRESNAIKKTANAIEYGKATVDAYNKGESLKVNKVNAFANILSSLAKGVTAVGGIS